MYLQRTVLQRLWKSFLLWDFRRRMWSRSQGRIKYFIVVSRFFWVNLDTHYCSVPPLMSLILVQMTWVPRCQWIVNTYYEHDFSSINTLYAFEWNCGKHVSSELNFTFEVLFQRTINSYVIKSYLRVFQIYSFLTNSTSILVRFSKKCFFHHLVTARMILSF